MKIELNDFSKVVVFSIVLAIFGTGFLIGTIYAKYLFNDTWIKDSVAKGFAEYNSKTGEWQWKKPLEKNFP